jgi:hypothetical protein
MRRLSGMRSAYGMRVKRHLRVRVTDVVGWLDKLGEVDSV